MFPSASTLKAIRRTSSGTGADDVFNVGVFVPLRGRTGIWGPSAIACAQLAESELNSASGIARRPCRLQFIDASDESSTIEAQVIDLVRNGEVDALVCMCISSVRERIVGALHAIGASVPIVYTCLHEGCAPAYCLFAIGETAWKQLGPALRWFGAGRARRRWMLVGNDCIWPHVSHRIAQACIAQDGGEVVEQVCLPFGLEDYSEVLGQLRERRVDSLLISMIGQDAVNFNRAFAQSGLAARIVRLSCAIEENQLLAIGAENTENLHVTLGYFSALQTDANLTFKERYRNRFGARAPTLNSMGQSLYEGMHFLATLMAEASAQRLPMRYQSARNAVYMGGGIVQAPMYLARAEGHSFRVLTRF